MEVCRILLCVTIYALSGSRTAESDRDTWVPEQPILDDDAKSSEQDLEDQWNGVPGFEADIKMMEPIETGDPRIAGFAVGGTIKFIEPRKSETDYKPGDRLSRGRLWDGRASFGFHGGLNTRSLRIPKTLLASLDRKRSYSRRAIDEGSRKFEEWAKPRVMSAGPNLRGLRRIRRKHRDWSLSER